VSYGTPHPNPLPVGEGIDPTHLVDRWSSLLEVQHPCHILIDFLHTAMRDSGGLHRRYEMMPAQGWPRGVERLVGRLVMLVGVHLREIIATGNLAQRGDQGFGSVPTVGVLLGHGHWEDVRTHGRGVDVLV
jgi:hypothetical protein